MSLKRITIIGGNGMVGHMLVMYLSKLGFKITTISRSSFALPVEFHSIVCNLLDFNELIELIVKSKPNYIINTLGVLNSSAEKLPSQAIRINSQLPKIIEAYFLQSDIKFIQISTDCVFTGSNGPYNELDKSDAISLYGITKSCGEVINKKDLTIRTSIIGPDIHNCGVGLLSWLLNSTSEIFGYKEAVWSGVTSLELAKFINASIIYDICGLVHLSNNDEISKYELILLINDTFKLNKSIIAQYGNRTNKVLINNRIKTELYKAPSYLKMISELNEWMINFDEIYNKVYLSNQSKI